MERTQGPKLEEVKRLKSDYEQLVQQVRSELLDQIDRAIAQLEELGYNYTVQETARATRTFGRRTVISGIQLRPAPSANFDAGKKCRVCGTAGHDGRAHRRQRGGRKPFTFDELAQLGLRPPATV
jgi:DNA repair exonuclease SbcCD ATPase subunit